MICPALVLRVFQYPIRRILYFINSRLAYHFSHTQFRQSCRHQCLLQLLGNQKQGNPKIQALMDAIHAPMSDK